MRSYGFLSIALLPLLYIAGFTSGESVDGEDVTNFPGNLVELGDSNPQLSTLMTLVRSVGLDEALSGEGPFTLFAPTNDAFEALSPSVVDYLTANEDALTSVLLYHVVSGALLASDLKNGPLTSLEGGDLDISKADTCCPMVNQASFIVTNLVATNGVAHGIDSVLIPPSVLLPSCPDTCCCECCNECTGDELDFTGCECECADDH